MGLLGKKPIYASMLLNGKPRTLHSTPAPIIRGSNGFYSSTWCALLFLANFKALALRRDAAFIVVIGIISKESVEIHSFASSARVLVTKPPATDLDELFPVILISNL